MFFTRDFRVGLSMLAQNNYISNKGFLSILQDIAEMHSASIGYGVTDIDKTNFSWALLNWKVKIISRPKYGDIVTIKTWARHSTKLYCYRDFEVINSEGKTIAIITSKWVLIDISKGKIARIEEDFVNKYNPEQKSVFNIVELEKIYEPEIYSTSIDYKVRKCEIDVNNHVNNLCYVDIALEVFPGSINEFNSCSEIEILYKHQIKPNDLVKAHYSFENGENYVVIKSSDDSILHSIIKFH